MMKKDVLLDELERSRVIGIFRNIELDSVLRVAKALQRGGVTFTEITLNTTDALHKIKTLHEHYGHEMYIGAGTVLTMTAAAEAIEAGAAFLVTPHTNVELIRFAEQKRVPIIVGAMTPTEVLTAWQAGATAIKLFPFSHLGSHYVKELRGPFDEIPLIAVGGVNAHNMIDVIEAGCVGVGMGSFFNDPALIHHEQYDVIEERARLLSRLP